VILAGLAILITVPHDVLEPQLDRRVDWIGAGVVTTSLVLLTFVLAQGEVAGNGWATPCKHFYLIFTMRP
jgi:hypothetical protein